MLTKCKEKCGLMKNLEEFRSMKEPTMRNSDQFTWMSDVLSNLRGNGCNLPSFFVHASSLSFGERNRGERTEERERERGEFINEGKIFNLDLVVGKSLSIPQMTGMSDVLSNLRVMGVIYPNFFAHASSLFRHLRIGQSPPQMTFSVCVASVCCALTCDKMRKQNQFVLEWCYLCKKG